MAMKRKGSKKSGKKRKARRRKTLSFGFFLLVCAILASIGVFILVQHQLSINNELKSQRIEQQIEAERAKQKSLRITLARLKSPSRIRRIAIDELGMVDPNAVIYLKYSRDANGNLVCQSSYEKVNKPATRRTEEKKVSGDQEEPSDTLTRR